MKVPTAGILLLVLAIHLDLVSGQDANCDFHINVKVGQKYFVNSPRYPNNYSSGVNCRWIATCPTGYYCRVNFPKYRLLQSKKCSLDRLLISRSGDRNLTDAAAVFCGSGSTSVVSTAQRISIGLISSNSGNNSGGRFKGILTAVPQQVFKGLVNTIVDGVLSLI